VKHERNQELLALVTELARPKYQALVGTVVEVLAEGPSKTNPERLVGRTSTNKVVVFDAGPQPERLQGQVLGVEVSHFHNFTLYGAPAWEHCR
jgi:tRNA-2-methylthio-N6-dimethylallyladenosine synthase